MPDAVSANTAAPQVLVEIQSGGGLSLSAAGRLFPAHRGDGTVDPSTVFRWVTKGARAADRRAVRLEAVRVGGRWLTSKGAITRFVALLTTTDSAVPASLPAARSTTTRRKSSERAARELQRRGA